MNMSWILIAVLTFLVVLVILSYIVEALRSAPKRPEALVWAPRIPIEYVDLDGIRVRCIKTGAGPNLVLLHTLRTQLDIFEKIIPELERHFTVHAFDCQSPVSGKVATTLKWVSPFEPGSHERPRAHAASALALTTCRMALVTSSVTTLERWKSPHPRMVSTSWDREYAEGWYSIASESIVSRSVRSRERTMSSSLPSQSSLSRRIRPSSNPPTVTVRTSTVSVMVKKPLAANRSWMVLNPPPRSGDLLRLALPPRSATAHGKLRIRSCKSFAVTFSTSSS